MEQIENINENEKFNYMLLSRLQNDCKYFLGFGNGLEKYLWAGTVEEHIEEMEKLYNNLAIKPEWITEEDIQKYKINMYKMKLEKTS